MLVRPITDVVVEFQCKAGQKSTYGILQEVDVVVGKVMRLEGYVYCNRCKKRHRVGMNLGGDDES